LTDWPSARERLDVLAVDLGKRLLGEVRSQMDAQDRLVALHGRALTPQRGELREEAVASFLHGDALDDRRGRGGVLDDAPQARLGLALGQPVTTAGLADRAHDARDLPATGPPLPEAPPSSSLTLAPAAQPWAKDT
jgi:hypothetical protein